jgi:hypothetical protein
MATHSAPSRLPSGSQRCLASAHNAPAAAGFSGPKEQKIVKLLTDLKLYPDPGGLTPAGVVSKLHAEAQRQLAHGKINPLPSQSADARARMVRRIYQKAARRGH